MHMMHRLEHRNFLRTPVFVGRINGAIVTCGHAVAKHTQHRAITHMLGRSKGTAATAMKSSNAQKVRGHVLATNTLKGNRTAKLFFLGNFSKESVIRNWGLAILFT